MKDAAYSDHAPIIGGQTRSGAGRTQQAIINPATGSELGVLHHATAADIDDALAIANEAFSRWRHVPPTERATILQRVHDLTIQRADEIALGITLDQGKPLMEARAEVLNSAEHALWHAQECRRIYGRVIPSRSPNIRQLVTHEPVGVCAAFTPWNFPFSQAIRKVCAAIGAGCTMILKGPEDTPSAITALAKLFYDAGLPTGCLSIVWGIPQEVAHHLVTSPEVRKISFTGSVPVGKELAALAGLHMKRSTMELGGHSPAIVLQDADVDAAAVQLATAKLRNAGQVCVSPSRFFVHEHVYERFLERFCQILQTTRLGEGRDPATQMGPLCHKRRVDAMHALVADARTQGAEVICGGYALDRPGYFYMPTVLSGTSSQTRVMQEEPFGPIAPILPFSDVDEAIEQANSLPYGLAAYVFGRTASLLHHVTSRIEAGMITVNHLGMGLAEIPFGGIKDSGYGREGGAETFDAYLNIKFVTEHC